MLKMLNQEDEDEDTDVDKPHDDTWLQLFWQGLSLHT